MTHVMTHVMTPEQTKQTEAIALTIFNAVKTIELAQQMMEAMGKDLPKSRLKRFLINTPYTLDYPVSLLLAASHSLLALQHDESILSLEALLSNKLKETTNENT